MKKYILTKERFEYKESTIVYDCCGCDYGLSSDDTAMTGICHISVTADPSGGYPCFTVPAKDVKVIAEG